MKLKILSWNVRGLNAAEKRMVVKLFVKGVRADIVCLQETKDGRDGEGCNPGNLGWPVCRLGVSTGSWDGGGSFVLFG